MKRYVAALLYVCITLFVAACKSGPTPSPLGVEVSVSGAFQFQEVGGAPVTLKATVTGDPGNQGVTWALSQANVSCSPACGTLQALKASPLSAVYTPPTSVPLNQQATITARSNKDARQNFVFNFQITAPITVSISPKFSTQIEGGPAVAVNATVNNDPSSPPLGVTWTLASSTGPCAPGCGTLTPVAAPSLSASYTPPNAATSGANLSPTITATSVADSTKSDSFSFTLAPPPISVSISNKFTSTTAGGSAVTVKTVVTNDQFYSNAGVTWALTSTVNGVTGPCTPTCGTLTPSSSPSLSASYTPPATAPTDANATPTITATSVSDTTKSDSFSFNILSPASVFKGVYVFQLRGFDTSGAPMATTGVFTSDGLGNVTGVEVDMDDNFVVTSASGLSGTYTLDTTSFNGIPRVTVCIALASGACSTVGGAKTVVLKGALSSDGTRGGIIEYDNSLALMAGSMLKQDPTALTGTSVAGNYAFELDSDAGTSTLNGVTTTGRIVEAGQFVFAAGAAGITGGVVDGAQAQQPTYLIGTGVSPAPITTGAATPPDASGRGTFTLSINNNGTTYATNYAYYIVNSRQLDLIEVDSGGTLLTVQSGTAQRQNTLTANSLNATSVVALTGSAPLNGAKSTAVLVGVLTVSGNSTAANYETNFAGGNTNQNPNIITGSVFTPLDPTTGRALLLNTFFTSAAVYLYDTGKGFLIDITSGSSHALSGPLIPQALGPFTASEIGGTYIGLAGGSSVPAIPNLDFAASLDANAMTYSDEVDFTSNLSVGPSGNGQVQNFAFTGFQWVLVDPASGRGEISFPPTVFGDFTSTTGQPTFASFYLIGPRQFVAIGQGSDGLGGEPSGVLFFDPQ